MSRNMTRGLRALLGLSMIAFLVSCTSESNVDQSSDSEAESSIWDEYALDPADFNCPLRDSDLVNIDGAASEGWTPMVVGESVINEYGTVVTITDVQRVKQMTEIADAYNDWPAADGKVYVRVGFTAHNSSNENVGFYDQYLDIQTDRTGYSQSRSDVCGVDPVVLLPGSTIAGYRTFADIHEDQTPVLLGLIDQRDICDPGPGYEPECPEQ